ncbi:MAG: D-glycero-beta-D-manno-heptose-7-phosphate kinase [Veillonellaceae bacterium]|nr:D-glycero-beta-D-manno-heptose-7-phosphate kinase [Veillonellaceae bacterium]
MHSWLEKIAAKRVLVVGDIMLDRYYFAEVTRISPEGPVPVAKVKETKNTLGGAANVAHNLARLGCQVLIAGISGDDENRQILDRKFNALGIGHAGLLKIQRPTTTKVRVVGGHQQMLRLDFEDAGRIARSVENRLLAYLARQLEIGMDAVILSDYAKGVCSPALCRNVVQTCRQYQVPLVVDPKGAQWQKYKGAFLVTPNVKELGESSRAKVGNDDKTIVAVGSAIRQRFAFESLMVTRSEQGLTLLAADEPVHIPTYAREVFDVSGAGDTVAAVMGAALAAGLKSVTAAHLANLAAGVVVGKLGTYAISAAELDAALSDVERLEDWER